MHDDHRRGICSLWLPVTMAQHLDVGLDVNQPLFRRGHLITARQEVAGDGLRMCAHEEATWRERLAKKVMGASSLSIAQGMRNGVQSLRAWRDRRLYWVRQIASII